MIELLTQFSIDLIVNKRSNPATLSFKRPLASADPKIKQLDLGGIIETNYNPTTKTLDLTDAVGDADIHKLLENIKMHPIYHQIERIVLRHNQFKLQFDPELPSSLKHVHLKECGEMQQSCSNIVWNNWDEISKWGMLIPSPTN